eukprot:gene34084-45694_t
MDFEELFPAHTDVIHDIVFDFYGKRFATSSSDRHIRIWSMDKSDKWDHKFIDLPANGTGAHQESIWRLSWANPEFGQVIASCSEDGMVCIWEEKEATKWSKKAAIKIAANSGNKKIPVNDVKFAPHNFGLKIATASGDGFIRIHEAPDVFDLTKWDLLSEYLVDGPDSIRLEHGLTCLAWNDNPFEPAKIAVGGFSRRAVTLTFSDSGMNEECMLGELHGNPVHDIAWAPSMGRSYHLIATASREPFIRIHKLKKKDDGALEYISPSQVIETPNKSNVCRVAWNSTGTMLATASEDETLYLWRKNFSGAWVNIQSHSAVDQLEKIRHWNQFT